MSVPDFTDAAPEWVLRFNIPGDRVMQSFVQDPDTGDWFVAKVGSGNGGDDTRIYRLPADGSEVLDWATLAGGGHGSTMGLTSDGGDVWLWFWWRLDTTGGSYTNRCVKWKYSGTTEGKTVLRNDADVTELSDFWGGDYVTYAIDQANDLIAVSDRDSTAVTRTYELRKLSEYEAGTDNVLHTVGPQDVDFEAAYQGHGFDDQRLYEARGNVTLGFPLTVHSFDWSTGAEQTIDVTSSTFSTPDWHEIEGVTVDPAGDLLFGIVTGAQKSRTADVYKLVEQAPTPPEEDPMQTFSTDTDPSLFMELANGSTPTRLAKDSTVLVRSALDGTPLASTTVINDLGYLSFQVDGVIGVEVSGDNGATWKGPFWSKEARQAAVTGAPNTGNDGGGSGTASWGSITGKPPVIAAGTTQAAARSVIAAGTSDLVIGTTSGTAMAGNAPLSPSVHRRLSEFDGADDDAKLEAFITYASAQTYSGIACMLDENRQYIFDDQHQIYNGFGLVGAGRTTDQARSTLPIANEARVRTNGGLFTLPDGQVWSVYIGGVSFNCSSNASVIEPNANSVLWNMTLDNIGFQNGRSVIGTSATRQNVDLFFISGSCMINNVRDVGFNLGGSDNFLKPTGCNYDSAPAFIPDPTGHYLWRSTALSKTEMEGRYITCDRVSGVLFDGDTVMGSLHHSMIEGRNAGTPCYGALIRVNGGIIEISHCWTSYAMSAPASGTDSTDLGVIHVADGDVSIDHCVYIPASGVATTVPYLYVAAGHARIRNMRGITTQTGGTSFKPVVKQATTGLIDADDSVTVVTA